MAHFLPPQASPEPSASAKPAAEVKAKTKLIAINFFMNFQLFPGVESRILFVTIIRRRIGLICVGREWACVSMVLVDFGYSFAEAGLSVCAPLFWV